MEPDINTLQTIAHYITLALAVLGCCILPVAAVGIYRIVREYLP